jgi:hypothetical protein
MGKKYHENNARADKKGEKERKDKGKTLTDLQHVLYNLHKKKGQALLEPTKVTPASSGSDSSDLSSKKI